MVFIKLPLYVSIKYTLIDDLFQILFFNKFAVK